MGQNLILNMNDHGFVVSQKPYLQQVSKSHYFQWWSFTESLNAIFFWDCALPIIVFAQVCAYNRTVSKVHDFLKNEAKGTKVIGAESLEDMVSKLKTPRRIVLLVKAGQAVDDFIDKLVSGAAEKRIMYV